MFIYTVCEVIYTYILQKESSDMKYKTPTGKSNNDCLSNKDYWSVWLLYGHDVSGLHSSPQGSSQIMWCEVMWPLKSLIDRSGRFIVLCMPQQWFILWCSGTLQRAGCYESWANGLCMHTFRAQICTGRNRLNIYIHVLIVHTKPN